jgi:glutaredoxin
LKITIYSKKDCHLCEDAKQLIDRLSKEYPIQLEVIDIEQDPALMQTYATEIPVVFIEGRKAFKYRIDENKFREIAARVRGTGQ